MPNQTRCLNNKQRTSRDDEPTRGARKNQDRVFSVRPRGFQNNTKLEIRKMFIYCNCEHEERSPIRGRVVIFLDPL